MGRSLLAVALYGLLVTAAPLADVEEGPTTVDRTFGPFHRIRTRPKLTDLLGHGSAKGSGRDGSAKEPGAGLAGLLGRNKINTTLSFANRIFQVVLAAVQLAVQLVVV